MRICLVARNRFHNDRKAMVTYRALVRAGHDVVVVAVDDAPPEEPVLATVTARAGASPLTRWLGGLIPAGARRRAFVTRLASAAAELDADLYLPLHSDVLGVAVDAARRSGGAVQRTPAMADAGPVDLIDLAPARPDLAEPVRGTGSAFTPADNTAPYEPEPNRFSGERVVICYRKTGANPGRYLESALRRAGFEVRLETEAIDLDTVDPGTRFVIFVESPYPAIGVTGTTTVPIMFWAHHGEHHLHANVRLTDRYRADAVLLAHSWHLAHWFPTPVHRFPLAVAPELFTHPQPLADRRFDVAMVGSKLRSDAWQYRRRSELISEIESSLPTDRFRFVEGVAPEEMAGIYGDSRIVINEGGVRHYPITMRIFEAIGAGSVLLTDPVPGLDLLFQPDRQFAVLSDDVVADIDRILGKLEESQSMVDRAIERARGLHTYDHRVDLLVTLAAEIPKRDVPPPSTRSELGRLIDADVDVQRLVHDEVPGLDVELPDREVWSLPERSDRLSPASMDAAVITADTITGLEPLLDSARRYIYAGGDVAGLQEHLLDRHPNAITYHDGVVRRIDLMTEAYRAKPAESHR
jgi:hypothetical protein